MCPPIYTATKISHDRLHQIITKFQNCIFYKDLFLKTDKFQRSGLNLHIIDFCIP